MMLLKPNNPRFETATPRLNVRLLPVKLKPEKKVTLTFRLNINPIPITLLITR